MALRLARRLARRGQHLVGADAARPLGERDEGAPVPPYRPGPDPGVTRRRRADELVQRHLVRAGQRQQQLQGRPAPAGLQPGQRAHRDAGGLGELGERGAAPLADRAQPRPDRVEHRIVVHTLYCCFGKRICQIGWCRSDGQRMNENENYDVVVVGGGAAGLSGAVALARSRRSVLVVDAGDPRNAPAGHVHNFLSRDGTPPSELYATGRAEVTGYGGRVETGRVTALARDGARFGVQISAEAGPRTVAARRLLVATGVRDVLPDVPGLAARWGIDVLHCPYCHGWEVRDQRIGILSTGPAAVHQALLFQQLSPHVTLLRHTGPAPDAEQRALLEALGVAIADGVVEQVETGASGLTGVVLAGRGHLALDAVVVSPRMEARAELLEPLGLTPVEVLLGEHPIGTRIEADRTGATAVPGVWVAGNLTDPQAQVIGAAAAGLTAGAAINLDLVFEQARSRG